VCRIWGQASSMTMPHYTTLVLPRQMKADDFSCGSLKSFSPRIWAAASRWTGRSPPAAWPGRWALISTLDTPWLRRGKRKVPASSRLYQTTYPFAIKQKGFEPIAASRAKEEQMPRERVLAGDALAPVGPGDQNPQRMSAGFAASQIRREPRWSISAEVGQAEHQRPSAMEDSVDQHHQNRCQRRPIKARPEHDVPSLFPSATRSRRWRNRSCCRVGESIRA